MTPTIKRALAAVAAVLGLLLAGAGLWLASAVGSTGAATFTASPTTGTVVLTPAVLNRLDADVVITAKAPSDATIWLGVASPSDAKAVVGGSSVATTTGADTSGFTLKLTTAGEGATPAVDKADIWRDSAQGKGEVTMTLDQADAPESVVVRTDAPRLSSIAITVERKAWFVQAVVALVVGLALLAGAGLLWRSAHHAGATAADSGPSDADDETIDEGEVAKA